MDLNASMDHRSRTCRISLIHYSACCYTHIHTRQILQCVSCINSTCSCGCCSKGECNLERTCTVWHDCSRWVWLLICAPAITLHSAITCKTRVFCHLHQKSKESPLFWCSQKLTDYLNRLCQNIAAFNQGALNMI